MAATIVLTPSMAVEQARTMVLVSLGEGGQAQFRDVHLKKLGSEMIFCGKVNTRFGDGSLSGWRQVLIVVSGNPNARVMLTSGQPLERYVITESCRHGVQLTARDYSAALSGGY